MGAGSDRQKSDSENRRLYLDRNLLIVFGVTLMAVLGVASISPAMPEIAIAWGIPTGTESLLVSSFTLPGVIFTPILGVLGDRLGRKTVLLPSLVLFALAGFSCALAPSYLFLLIFRFLQGIGAASLGYLNLTIIGDLYKGQDRANAMGYNSSVTSIGTAAYPALGGFLAVFGWYFPFFLPLLALPIGVIVLVGLENPEPEENKTSFREYLRHAWRAMRNRQVFGILIASGITFIMLYGVIITYFSTFFTLTFYFDPLAIGLVIASMSIFTGLTATQVGKLTLRYSERTLILAAFPLYALALMFIPFSPVSGDLLLLLFPTLGFAIKILPLLFLIAIYGIAQGLNMPSLYTLLASLAPPEHRAALMSINGTLLRVGQTLGPILMGVTLLLWGINWVFWVGALFGLTMVPIIVVLLRP
ncbi:MAG: MFS transporter [Promethearchaeota archaeon]